MSDLRERLRAHGLRLTPQRERVLRAVGGLGHGTPEEILGVVNEDGGVTLPASTVYRCLDALEESGVVAHTHLDHRAPSYQLASHDDHVHLVCHVCGSVDEISRDMVADLVGRVRGATGFDADLTHMAIHGRCARCSR